MKMREIRLYDRFELTLAGPDAGNPFAEVTFRAAFTCRDVTQEADGFYDGAGQFVLRFLPRLQGEWRYVTSSNRPELDGVSGSFLCVPPAEGVHGMVGVVNTYHFAHEDGAPYYPVGTTCYVWNLQGDALEEQTLETLRESPFNKIRMSTFPKHYDYNHNEPASYPFEGDLETGWDFTRPNPAYFAHLEKRIDDLMAMGIEADLILFHPYDRWGFSTMTPEQDDFYVKYILARLSSFRNIWWSLANEHDLFDKKTPADWERLGCLVQSRDPYSHLRSIHNCMSIYDHNRPWITHCSLQRTDVYRTAEETTTWRATWRKPIVIDECAYEGDVELGWGNLSGEEMTRRFWEAFARGGYCGHGETYLDPDEVIWWAKGGKLRGTSPARIAFLREFMEKTGRIDPLPGRWDEVVGGRAGEISLHYYSFMQPAYRLFSLPEGARADVSVIDTWNMTVERLPGGCSGDFRVDLPGRPYMAVLVEMI